MQRVCVLGIAGLMACADAHVAGGGDAAPTDARVDLDATNDAPPPIDAPDVPLAIMPTMQEAYVKGTAPDPNDNFGWSVALSMDGSTLAVGASGEDGAGTGVGGNPADDSRHDTGAVFIYRRTGGVWMFEAYIKASNPDLDDQFGLEVALSASGDTLLVGATWESSAATGVNGAQADNSASQAGAAYVFRRSGSTWTQDAYLKASNTGANDWFGSALALSGDGRTAVVCALQEDSSGTGVGGAQNDAASDAGAAYIFQRDATTWTQVAYVKATNTDAHDGFCTSAAISTDGLTLAIGATNESSSSAGVGGNQADNSMGGAGAVYVYRKDGATWTPAAYVKATNPTGSDGFFPGDWFGYRVALSADGSRLAASARFENSGATGVGGNQQDESAIQSGAAYVYRRAAGTWTPEAYIKASNTGGGSRTEPGDEFGDSLSLSADGRRLAVGASWEESRATGLGGIQSDDSVLGAGAAYVYQRTGTTWRQDVYVKASNTSQGWFFGVDLALAGDGLSLVVGAYGDGGSGAAYVFR